MLLGAPVGRDRKKHGDEGWVLYINKLSNQLLSETMVTANYPRRIKGGASIPQL